MSDVFNILVIVVLVLLAGFLAMAGASVSRLNRVKAHHMAQKNGTKNAGRLERIVEDPAPFMNVLVLLTVLSYISATALASAFALRTFDTAPGVVAVLVMTIVIFVFAEIAPRNYAVQHPERAALFSATPVYLLGKLLNPLGRVLILVSNAVMVIVPGRALPKGPFVTEEEIRHLVDVAEEEEEIEDEERELIHSIFEFGDTVVREVMVPRPDMAALPASASVREALEMISKHGFSRIPTYEGDVDNIVGIVYAKDLLKKIDGLKRDAKLSSLGRAPNFVPEQKRVLELLREMQAQRVHIGVVVDEYGGTAGLVTIEDLLEEIVGEIADEYDRDEQLVEPVDSDRVRVDARVPIDEVNELLDVLLPDDEWDTIGGLVFGLTGRVPRPGEKLRYDSVEFVTERVTGRRIQKVLITKIPEPESAGE
jgi:CBS domain containing-hemolysin-like protein